MSDSAANQSDEPSSPADSQSAAEAFEDLWQEKDPPDLQSFLAQQGELATGDLCSVLRVDLRERWERQDPVLAEEYLQRFPNVASDSEVAIDLIYSEFLLRERLGLAPLPEEYAARFPTFAEQLLAQMKLHEIAGSGQSSDTFLGESVDTHRAQFPDLLSEEATETLNGTFGRYQVEKLVGRGGMGSVYRARDMVLERTVAIKVPRFVAQLDPTAVERFYREAKAAARITHPNLCTVYDVGEIQGRLFIAMQYLPGATLAETLRRDGSFAVPRAVALTIQLARALGTAHDAGILHRDLKPANIILTAQGDAVVMDFGLAQLHTSQDVNLTHSGAFVGTPAYASPEQLAGKVKTLTPASDVYSLGVILFHMLAGRPPFSGSMAVVMKEALVDEPPSLEELRPGTSPELIAICLRCLRKQPTERYASMQALADALQRLQPMLSDSSPPPPAPDSQGSSDSTLLSDVVLVAEPEAKPPPANRRRVLIMFATIAVAIAGFGVYSSLSNRLDDSAVQPGTRWSGKFEFIHDPPTTEDAALEITQRDGPEVSGIYSTENKFAWDVVGKVEDGRIRLQFVSVNRGDAPAHLIETGLLEGTVQGKVMDLLFSDASDGSRAEMQLKRE